MPMVSRIANGWHKLVWFLTGEWMLTAGSRRPNGGSVVLARSIWTSTLVYLALIAAREALDPGKSWEPSWTEFRLLLLDTISWFGALFAAAYASLYARFSSQWTYLANLYNQIRATELRVDARQDSRVADLLASWKAGFMEDADDLHLSSKPLFASVIVAWNKEPAVAAAFVDAAVGGQSRLDGILAAATKYYEAHQRDLPGVPAAAAIAKVGQESPPADA